MELLFFSYVSNKENNLNKKWAQNRLLHRHVSEVIYK